MVGEPTRKLSEPIQISGNNRTVMVTVTIGKSQDVRTDTSFVDVIVGDPEVADVNPLTDHALSILAKKIGTTRVSVYAEGKKLVGIFDVEVSYDITRLTNELRRRFPGLADQGLHCQRPHHVVGRSSRRRHSRQSGDDRTPVRTRDHQYRVGDVTAAGHAGSAFHRNFTNCRSRARLPVESLRQPQHDQYWFAPASAEPADQCAGERWQYPGRRSGRWRAVRHVTFGFMIARILGNGVTTDVLINALEQKGLARSLAEPNLVALSGDTASFLAGGEYPIPVSGSFGQITVDYKKYGVGLAFTPTVLGSSLINLKIEPEVSQIDTTHTIAVSNGVSVPALIVRRASTTVELRDGQSFVIGGLLQSDNKNAIDQLPWLGSVPVLGALFSSKSYQKNETDLAIIVTPHLVRPARPGDEVRAPTDDTLPPNDVDFFLLGKTEVTRQEARQLTPVTARFAVAGDRPLTGHMLDLPKGDSNAAIQ